jgi:hypothetical protein
MAEALSLACIRELSDSNLGRNTGYNDLGFHDIRQSFHETYLMELPEDSPKYGPKHLSLIK